MPSIELIWSPRPSAFTKATELALVRALKNAGGDAIRATQAEAERRTRERVWIQAGYLADQALPLRFASGPTLEGFEWRMDAFGQTVPLAKTPIWPCSTWPWTSSLGSTSY